MQYAAAKDTMTIVTNKHNIKSKQLFPPIKSPARNLQFLSILLPTSCDDGWSGHGLPLFLALFMILSRVASLQASMAQNVPWPRALLRIWEYWVYVRGRSETINECRGHNVKGIINLQAQPQNKHSLRWQDRLQAQVPSRSYEAGPQMNNERPHNRTINAFKASRVELWHLWGISHVGI